MIAITGATGFVGRALCDEFQRRNIPVVRVGRGSDADVQWPRDGQDFGPEAMRALAGVRAVVHLAGAPIGVRWTAARRRAIRESRVDLTGTLARAVARLSTPPRVLLSMSAVGIYGNRGEEWLDESSAPGTDFLAGVAREWEGATRPASDAGVRVVHMRMGVVLGRGGGMLRRLRPSFLFGAGARLGDGMHWLSWIALEDVIRFVLRAIDDAAISGPVNVVSPNPVRNGEFTGELARALHRPALLALPPAALRAAFGDMATDVLLASQRVRPARLLANGFDFAHPSLNSALTTACSA